MDSADLDKLEKRVDDLIGACRRLQSENRTLKVSEGELAVSQQRLNEKMQLARARIEAMIGRLKALERGAKA